MADAAWTGLSLDLLDATGDPHQLRLGTTESDAEAALATLHALATTILPDAQVGEAIQTLLTPGAARLVARFLNHEVQRPAAGAADERRWDGELTYTRQDFAKEYDRQDGDDDADDPAQSKWDAARVMAPEEEEVDWLRREIVAPLRAGGELQLLCETAAGAAFLGAGAVQRVCVAELAQTIERRTVEEVCALFLPGAKRLPAPSALKQMPAMEAAFRSDCLVEVRPSHHGRTALSLRRAFVAVLLAEDSPAKCLTQDLVEDVCIAVGAGWISTEPELRAACAEGGREVVLDPEANITLSGEKTDFTEAVYNGHDYYGHDDDYDDNYEEGEQLTPASWAPGTGPLELADGTTLRSRGGIVRGGQWKSEEFHSRHTPVLARVGAGQRWGFALGSVRIDGVAIVDLGRRRDDLDDIDYDSLHVPGSYDRGEAYDSYTEEQERERRLKEISKKLGKKLGNRLLGTF